MSWPVISDTEIGVGLTLPNVKAAASAKLFTKFRERDRRLAQPFMVPNDMSATLTPPVWPYNVGWTTVKTLRMKPPTFLRGDQGTYLRMEAVIGMTRPASRNYSETVFARLQIVGYETVVSTDGTEGAVTFANFTALSCSGTVVIAAGGFWMHPIADGPQVVAVNCQLKIVSNAPGLLPAPTASFAITRSQGAVHSLEPSPE